MPFLKRLQSTNDLEVYTPEVLIIAAWYQFAFITATIFSCHGNVP